MVIQFQLPNIMCASAAQMIEIRGKMQHKTMNLYYTCKPIEYFEINVGRIKYVSMYFYHIQLDVVEQMC